MAGNEAVWAKVHGAFDPGEVLVGARSREIYCEREHSPFELIRREFDPALKPSRPPIVFFTGHRGSGKSSMLWRLLDRFKRDYFVVYFDIEHNLDSRTANQIDLLYLIGATIFQVAEQEGLKPDPENLRLLADSVYALTETKKEKKDESLDVVELARNLLCFGAGALGGGFGEKLAAAVLKPFNFTSGLSDEVVRKRQIEPQVQKIITNVNIIIADVQVKADRPPLLVVDGLDKLQQYEQAKLIFLDSRALFGPVCRIIYTVPMLIYTTPAFGQAEEEAASHFLPSVKLFEKTSAARYEPGYEALREVVARRLLPLGLRAADLFEPEALDLLIGKSGGIMRWLIRLVRDACIRARIRGQDKVDLSVATWAVDDFAARLGQRLTMKQIAALRQVRENKRPAGDAEAGELLHSLLVVAYRNKRTWFDVHPLIWEELEE